MSVWTKFTTAIVVIAALAWVFMGCSFHTNMNTNTAEQNAYNLFAAVKQLTILGLQDHPDIALDASAYIEKNILPQLKEDECAGVDLKMHVIEMLNLLGEKYDKEEWKAVVIAAIIALDAYYDPGVTCTTDNMMYLRALCYGINEGCKEITNGSK